MSIELTKGLSVDLRHLAGLCAGTDATTDLQALLEGISGLMPGLDWRCVLTRGGWHRPGGVVDAEHERVSDNIRQWAEGADAGDIDTLLDQYRDSGYLVTRLSGRTHYFTAPTGVHADEFVQLEIEELQEQVERPLVFPEWYPDSLEEFLDPLDAPASEPLTIGRPHYLFRRILPIDRLLQEEGCDLRQRDNLNRFFQDWQISTASDSEHFSRHWILLLREYINQDGETARSFRPMNTFPGVLPALPEGEALRGSRLANAIHGYDRTVGYPFAWFFNLLSRKGGHFALADAVLRDQAGAYDYLPARDLQVLRRWEERPYAV